MRSRTTALVALTSALVLVPAGVATAGSGPAPEPSPRAKSESTAPSPAGNPLSERARTAEVCADAYQIGGTRYVYREGVRIASVKQFYSPQCQENYGYVWVWQSFREKFGYHHVSTAIYSYTRDEVLGERSWDTDSGQEYWSSGTNTVPECTSAIGSVRLPGEPLPNQAASPKRC